MTIRRDCGEDCSLSVPIVSKRGEKLGFLGNQLGAVFGVHDNRLNARPAAV